MKLTQEIVAKHLSLLGNVLLKKTYRTKWSKENPTLGYCYLLSEVLYHSEEGDVHAYCLNLGEEIGTHWFVKVNGAIIDFTAAQFDFPLDYSKAVRKGFFKGGVRTRKGYISKRGALLAEHLGISLD